MICDKCNSTEQIVNTDTGEFCRTHYAEFKRGKSFGEPVEFESCENCGYNHKEVSGSCPQCGSSFRVG